MTSAAPLSRPLGQASGPRLGHRAAADPVMASTSPLPPVVPSGPGSDSALSEPEARLLLAQLLSPAFPVGSYAYSQGLEVAMVQGLVHDATSLGDWVEAVVAHGSARIDLWLLAEARKPGADLPALAALAYAYAPAKERAAEMRDQGAAFTACARALGLAPPDLPTPDRPTPDLPTPDLPYPVALGAATASLPLTTPEVAALYLQALAAQLTSAAVRFLPLSATLGQRLIARLAPMIVATAEGPHALTSAHLAADMAAMAHETLQPRIFRS